MDTCSNSEIVGLYFLSTNIKVTDEDVTSVQKQALIASTTKLLQEVLYKDPKATFVVIDEISTDNWGAGGEQVTRLHSKRR